MPPVRLSVKECRVGGLVAKGRAVCGTEHDVGLFIFVGKSTLFIGRRFVSPSR